MSVDLQDATRLAETKLLELAREAGVPLVFYEGRLGTETVGETDWCWVFRYQSLAYVESGIPLDQVAAGPIVVPKDGTEPLTLGTYASEEQQLEDCRLRRGPYAGPGPTTR